MITGAAGYLGTVLTEQMLTGDHNVTAVDIGWFPDGAGYLMRLREAHPGRLTVKRKDVRHLIHEDFSGIDAVFHLAGLSNDPMAEYDPESNMDINYWMTLGAGASARAAGVRLFVFASSASVYDGCDPATPATWDDAPDSSPYPYTDAKLKAESALATIADDRFSVALFRQGTLWGVSPRMRYDLVVNTMMRDAMTTGGVTCVEQEDGTPHMRPICHVADCARAYGLLLKMFENGNPLPVVRENIVTENVAISDVAVSVADACETHNHNVGVVYKHVPKVRTYQCQPTSLVTKIYAGRFNLVGKSAGPGLMELAKRTYFQSIPSRYDTQTRNIDWFKHIDYVSRLCSGESIA